jgi:hypothetical protein
MESLRQFHSVLDKKMNHPTEPRILCPDELLDEIKLAYKVHRLRPIRGFFFITRENSEFACPLAALAIHRGIMDGVRPGFEFAGGAVDAGAIVTVEWAVKTFGNEWVMGFLDGFEGQTLADGPVKTTDYLQGYNLGLEAAKQLIPHDISDSK